MVRLFFIFIIAGSLALCASDTDLNESKGTDQSVMASLSPAKAQIDVWNNVKIEISFNVPIDASSVQKNNIKLVHLSSKTNDHIDGAISYDKYDNKVIFIPSALLPVGTYEVEIKSLKADKAYKSTQIKEIKYRFYVPEVIHGHQLPPEPDPVVNNSTLLGIDVNNNGVRDDVEIWILNKYKEKHPIYIDVAMQVGRAWQKILEDPNKARETTRFMDAAQECEFYFTRHADRYGDPILIHEDISTDREFDKIVLNTEIRENAYGQYEDLLSGGLYFNASHAEKKKYCDFNLTNYLQTK